MSIFKQRISQPNQLATLREMEGKAAVGRVLHCEQSLAIVSGLNADAPVGTLLSFVSGGQGVLLWHRSANLAFALVLGGAASITVGEAVECKIAGVLQVVDDAAGPTTRKDFELCAAPVGAELFGRAVDFLGRPAGATGSAALGGDRTKPLVNPQIDMNAREQICECLLTGVKALDALTPLGRGACLLVIGADGSGKTTLALDAVLGQAATGVKCVYALTTQSGAQGDATVAALRNAGALANTVVVRAAADAPLGERYAAICYACSIGGARAAAGGLGSAASVAAAARCPLLLALATDAPYHHLHPIASQSHLAEAVRDAGGHALVVVDDLKPLIDVWETLVLALARLGQEKIREGLIKDSEGREIDLQPQGEEGLVDYEGMLVSGAVAQRRGFFSTFFLRAAKLARSGGGGSMTLLPLVPGRPATGVSQRIDTSKYTTLSEEQRSRIAAALAKRAEAAPPAAQGAREMATEVVEEFISIADGQLVLAERDGSAGAGAPYRVNPRLSITRLGTRAYYKALEAVATQARLDLAQADDARRFSAGTADPQVARADAYSQRLQAALLQPAGRPASLAEQARWSRGGKPGGRSGGRAGRRARGAGAAPA